MIKKLIIAAGLCCMAPAVAFASCPSCPKQPKSEKSCPSSKKESKKSTKKCCCKKGHCGKKRGCCPGCR